MKKIILTSIVILTLGVKLISQPCGVAQSLNQSQQTQIKAILNKLDAALINEDLFHIDSLSSELKNAYSIQAGRPDTVEAYYALVSNTNWIDLKSALALSKKLIAHDSMVYVDLWKEAKGMNRPSYQPHSLFLRASAEIAAGLLKIADKETDVTRKTLYRNWATMALDSLASMQLPGGAFPFPDLRPYGDPVFSPIIQNFLNSCGADSVNVLKNGWIIDDKDKGEFKFDAGVIANAYYEAYNYTGNINYKNITISIGNYLKPLGFNDNYNYNTFASLGLTRAFQLTNDTTYLERSIKTLRYSVYPGQIANGRWVDGHNANSRYHSIIIQDILPTIQLIPTTNEYNGILGTMAYKAIENLIDYSYTCGAATGYLWLLKAYQLNSSIIHSELKDSIAALVGRHVNQSAISEKFLDVPTMGEYIMLLDLTTDITFQVGMETKLFPNPTHDIINFVVTISDADNIVLSIFSTDGELIKRIDKGQKTKGTYSYQIDITPYKYGIYLLALETKKQIYIQKIIKIE